MNAMLLHFCVSLRPKMILALVMTSLLAVNGCRTLDDRPATGAAADLIAERTGVSAVGAGPDDTTAAPWADAGVLSREDAVATALSRHPAIAADMARIREAHAQWVQAGLLPNPVLGASLGIEPGGNVGQLTASLSQMLSAIWQRPAREAAADAQLQSTLLRVSHNALELAGEVQRLHRQIVYHQQTLGLFEERRALADRLVQAATDRAELGLGHAMDIRRYERDRHQLQLEKQQTTSELATAQQRLLEAMGMADASLDWQARVEPLPDLAIESETQAVATGLALRLDVQAARWSATAAEHEVNLMRQSAWPDLTAGVEVEREDGVNRIGPAASLELPIFDQGQARRATAHARHQQRSAQHDATVQRATYDVRSTWMTMISRRQQLDHHEQTLLPHAEATVDQVRAAFDTGDADRLDVLHAELEHLNARRRLLLAQLDHDLAVINCKQALGGMPASAARSVDSQAPIGE